MADNTTLNSGTGGDVIASDDIGGVKHQRVKLSVGADGAASDAVPVSNGMDVTGAAVQAVGLVGQFDDVSVGTVTENQFAPVRISTRRALLVEGVASGTAMPVSAASLPLPSGAATLAEQQTQSTSLASAVTALQILDNVVSGSEAQVDVVAALPAGDNNIGNVDIVTMPAVTNAGTFAVQVDGAALTALQLIDDPVQVLGTDTYTEATSKGVTIGAVRRDADTTLVNTTNEFGPLQMDANGRLKVEAFSGETLPVSLASVPSHAVTNVGTFAVQAAPTSAAAWGVYVEDAAETAGGNLMMAGSVRRDTAASSAGTTGDNATLNTDSIGALWTRDTASQVDDAAFTPATSRVMPTGYVADETATDSVDEGDAGAARMTLDRKQIVTLQPHTTGGLSTFMASGSDGSSILVATAQVIKASAGQLYGYYAYNPESAVTFVHFYNTAAASVTVGTTSPLFTIAIPAGSAANLSIPQGITFSNAGWSCAATTTAGGNTAPSTGVSLVAWYM